MTASVRSGRMSGACLHAGVNEEEPLTDSAWKWMRPLGRESRPAEASVLPGAVDDG